MDERTRKTLTASFFAALAFVARAHAQPVATATSCTIRGTTHADVLVGTPGRDVICGLGGDDTIMGGGGDDVLVGGAGDDTIAGGAGHDTMLGGPGNDTFSAVDGVRDLIDGGPGADAATADTIDVVLSADHG